ncbi:hypothetical protein AAG570_012993 [Ranatra chinensis]|uniref:Uncharacterized protein n=1 Tax=Ranatra chinensis TaxID=642074 RepID=A0ABD0YFG9_9HEMI
MTNIEKAEESSIYNNETIDRDLEEITSAVDNELNENEGTEGKSAVKVVGMEMTESCEGGAKWSRPPTPLSRPPTPQNIYLPGSLPSQSQLLVSDSHTETLPSQDNAVVLTGKVTLSLIGLMEPVSYLNYFFINIS